MYQLEDEGSVYNADLPPSEFIETKTDILVLQDRDFEDASLDEVSMAVESALNDLDALGKARLIIESAKSNTSLSTDHLRQELRHLRSINGTLSQKYNGSKPTFALETIMDRQRLILAMEEETNSEASGDKDKGWFMKIVEAISNAFKWLWKKITSIFSSSSDGEKTKKELEEVKTSLENPPPLSEEDKRAVEENIKEGMTDTTLEKSYAFLGKEVKASDVILHTKKLFDKSNVDKMTSLVDAIASDFGKVLAAVPRLNETKDQKELETVSKTVFVAIRTAFEKFELLGSGDAEFAKGLMKSLGEDSLPPRGLYGFPENKVLVLGSNASGTAFSAKFTVLEKIDEPKPKAEKVELPTADEIKTIIEMLSDDLIDSIGSLTKECEEKAKLCGNITDRLKGAFDSISEDKRKDAGAFLKQCGTVFNELSITVSAAAHGTENSMLRLKQYVQKARDGNGLNPKKPASKSRKNKSSPESKEKEKGNKKPE